MLDINILFYHNSLFHLLGEKLDFVPPEIIVPPEDSVFKKGEYPAVLECIVNARYTFAHKIGV